MQDVTNATVDNLVDIEFLDNQEWRTSVTDVLVDGISVGLQNGDISVAGHLILNPSTIPALQTPGNKTIKVVATGFDDSETVQNIAVGEFSENNSSLTQAFGYIPAPGRGFIMTLKAKDQYNNAIQGYQFKLGILVNNINESTSEYVRYYNNNYTSSTTEDLLIYTDNQGEAYPAFQWSPLGNAGDSTEIVWKDRNGIEIFDRLTVQY